jgi:rhodanese-related sulfurtransferase
MSGKTIKIILLLGILTVAAVAFGLGQKTKQTDQSLNPQLTGPVEFSKLVKDEKNFLLDVHTPEQTHIPGTKKFIPFDQIAGNVDQLPEDKTTKILVYCRSGSMSKIAAEKILELGYTNVYDLKGGINGYRESNVEVKISPANQDLGEVIYGDVATTTFTFTNFSPAPIKITGISTSCGCTKAVMEKKDLKAYEAAEIKVSFDPAVHKDDTDLGDLIRTIYIETDNPNFPRLTSAIVAKVIKK